MPETDENRISSLDSITHDPDDRSYDSLLGETDAQERCLVLVGRVRGVLLGLRIEDTKGVDRISHVTTLPHTRSYITGLVYFHGGIEAAVDAGVIIGGGTIEITHRTRAVLAEAAGMRGVILFDELLDMPEINVEEITPVEVFDIPEEPIAGKFSFNGEAGFILHPEGLFKYIVGDR